MSTTRYIVNNVTGQTINGQSVTPSYKVYTALLTQSGGDNPLFIGSGEITIGVTYVINKGKGGTGDFTNVGAPNNNDGTYFVATGTTPNEWGDTELGYNEGAPVVTVLENTIGDIWFTYEGFGNYIVNSNGLFTINKTWGISDATYDGINFNINIPVFLDFTVSSDLPNSFYIRVQGGDNSGNDMIKNTPIEIRVYN